MAKQILKIKLTTGTTNPEWEDWFDLEDGNVMIENHQPYHQPSVTRIKMNKFKALRNFILLTCGEDWRVIGFSKEWRHFVDWALPEAEGFMKPEHPSDTLYVGDDGMVYFTDCKDMAGPGLYWKLDYSRWAAFVDQSADRNTRNDECIYSVAGCQFPSDDHLAKAADAYEKWLKQKHGGSNA